MIIIIAIACYLVVTVVISAITGYKIDKAGYKVEKRTRTRYRTYKDGFGKYPVTITDEEYVVVPKDEKK